MQIIVISHQSNTVVPFISSKSHIKLNIYYDGRPLKASMHAWTCIHVIQVENSHKKKNLTNSNKVEQK